MVEQLCMIRMMYWVRLVDRVSSHVLREGVVVKIEDMTKLSAVVWSCSAWKFTNT